MSFDIPCRPEGFQESGESSLGISSGATVQDKSGGKYQYGKSFELHTTSLKYIDKSFEYIPYSSFYFISAKSGKLHHIDGKIFHLLLQYTYRTGQTCCQLILRYIHYFGGILCPGHLGSKRYGDFSLPFGKCSYYLDRKDIFLYKPISFKSLFIEDKIAKYGGNHENNIVGRSRSREGHGSQAFDRIRRFGADIHR